MLEAAERPFADLPAALVQEVLDRTEGLSQALLDSFEQVRDCRAGWREQLEKDDRIRREAELAYVPIPTTCGVDGSYAIERLLATDLVAAAAVAVEGLTPPSETRYWPEPRHQVFVGIEPHDSDTGTILRAIMMGMELELAANAPHEVVFLDGSLTTPLIHFNQALNQVRKSAHLHVVGHLCQKIVGYLEAYEEILASKRTDRSWIAVPKYTTRREIGRERGWPESYDDRGLLSHILEPGEFTRPIELQQPAEPWHLNVSEVSSEDKDTAERLGERIVTLLDEIRVLYYRPYSWLPALRLEISQAVAENHAHLATVLHGVRHQCGAPGIMEPYPLYMADRMVKHLPRAIPTFRQVTSQRIAETYQGNITEVFLGLHGYRTESGV
ncbi:MAG: DNA double-strand break repair nuclease NurA [Anaerolineae bacterium]